MEIILDELDKKILKTIRDENVIDIQRLSDKVGVDIRTLKPRLNIMINVKYVGTSLKRVSFGFERIYVYMGGLDD